MAGLLKESVVAEPEHAQDQPWFADQSSGIKSVTLSEWEETDPIELTKQQAGRLENTRWLSVRPCLEDGWWKLKAKQYVGAFVIDGLRVIVRPKIDPHNLFLMLEVGLHDDAWLPEAMEYAETHDLLSALLSFFARTAETTLARGLFHSYRRHEEDLLTLRGRLDFSRQFRRVGMLVPMACSFDAFTADVAENRYLKAAMQLAVRVAEVPVEDRRRLKRMLAALEDVGEVAEVPVEADHIERITFTRLNEHYLPAMRLARLILGNLTLQDQHGDTSASAFMLDMNDLFERFVTERLRQELAGRLEVKPKERRKLDTRGCVTIEPDLLFRQDGELVGVADIKYKLRDAGDDTGDPAGIGPGDGGDSPGSSSETIGAAVRATHADYYQLLAYTTALGLRGGTLIYCVDAGAKTECSMASRPSHLTDSTIEVKHTGKRLDVVGIDLSGTPAHVQQQITALADRLLASTLHPRNSG